MAFCEDNNNRIFYIVIALISLTLITLQMGTFGTFYECVQARHSRNDTNNPVDNESVPQNHVHRLMDRKQQDNIYFRSKTHHRSRERKHIDKKCSQMGVLYFSIISSFEAAGSLCVLMFLVIFGIKRILRCLNIGNEKRGLLLCSPQNYSRLSCKRQEVIESIDELKRTSDRALYEYVARMVHETWKDRSTSLG